MPKKLAHHPGVYHILLKGNLRHVRVDSVNTTQSSVGRKGSGGSGKCVLPLVQLRKSSELGLKVPAELVDRRCMKFQSPGRKVVLGSAVT